MVFKEGDVVYIVSHHSYLIKPIGVVNRLSHVPGDYVIEVRNDEDYEDYYSFEYTDLRLANKFFRRLYEI